MVATYKNAFQGTVITNQGGEAYEVDALKKFQRFLILGTEGGTFYASEQKLTLDHMQNVRNVIDQYGVKAVDMIVKVSEGGRAPKNDPALAALAIAASAESVETRRYALQVLPRVARTPTHLFHFVEYVTKMRGWGKQLRRGIANWYLQKDNDQLAYQVSKYVQRDGWSNADLLRLSHPMTFDETKNKIFRWVVDGYVSYHEDDRALDYLYAVERVKVETDIAKIVQLIQDYNLPREVLPTFALNNPEVWEALLEKMPTQAMLRNLGVMSSVGLLNPFSDSQRKVVERLQKHGSLRRIHPLDILKAKMVFEAGHGVKSDKTWDVNQAIIDTLEDSFYASFGEIEPTYKRLLLALDVSGSMQYGEYGNQNWLGIPNFSPRIAAAVLAMVTARTEPDFHIMAFSNRFIRLNISRHDSLETVMKKTGYLPSGGTDCALPMEYARKNKLDVDAFIVYTDSETGGFNPMGALKLYRNERGIKDAKLIVNAMVSSYYSIADPSDPNTLDCVGFDTATPMVMSDFIRGEI